MSGALYANDPNQNSGTGQTDGISPAVWVSMGVLAVGVLGFLAGRWDRSRTRQNEQAKTVGQEQGRVEFQRAHQHTQQESGRERYENTLRQELGSVRMLGSPDIPNVPVQLLDTFVSLDISTSWRTDQRFDPRDREAMLDQQRHLDPDSVIQRAFQRFRLLLLIGDPGSGKTTLMKYYAMCCLSGEYDKLGFDLRPLPIYLPLRRVAFAEGRPLDLPENLARWAQDYQLGINAETFRYWLDQEPVLLLLDGLDEISDLDERRVVCEWIDGFAPALQNAQIVITSRWTGYRKVDGVEIGFDHLRADLRDFSAAQQADFLRKWTRAAHLGETAPSDMDLSAWETGQARLAEQQAQKIIDFLRHDGNRAVRELAAVPMLLQIIAVIWKERGILLQARSDLFRAAVNYLLDFRDRKRKLDPLLAASDARRVLEPVAGWMQQGVKADEVVKTDLHAQMQPILADLPPRIDAEAFCHNLRDRAGLIADYGQTRYIWRHKSFREYLAGVYLTGEVKSDPQQLKQIVMHLGDDWWEEALRFFMAEADDRVFDGFMDALFRSDLSRDLSVKQQGLLQTLISDARQRPLTALVKCLNDRRLHDSKKFYILDALKTIGTDEALAAIQEFEKQATSVLRARAAEITAQEEESSDAIAKELEREPLFTAQASTFLNPYELNAEYILISEGSYAHSVTKEQESVSALYFAKYPVTNRRYRRFIKYLQGQAPELQEMLPGEVFTDRLSTFVRQPGEKDFAEYLGTDVHAWSGKLRSGRDDEKRFNHGDQPVVAVTWYAARAYCLWLSTLWQTANPEQTQKEMTFRLPTEVEWEWAAGGGKRTYPWGEPEPSEKHANYGDDVGATTQVGKYPDGGTPAGLMEMAGNAWEWTADRYGHEEYPEAVSVRGGAWYSDVDDLLCSARSSYLPSLRYGDYGFRVVCSQS